MSNWTGWRKRLRRGGESTGEEAEQRLGGSGSLPKAFFPGGVVVGVY